MAIMPQTGITTTVEVLRSDIGDLADEITSLFGSSGDASAADVIERVHRIREDFDVLFSEASSGGRELIRRAHLDGVTQSIENTVRERPFTMLAVAAGLGMAVAAWPRSSSAERKESDRSEDSHRRGSSGRH